MGIGNTSPPDPLSFSPFAFGNKILLYGNGSNAHIGIGMQNTRVQFYTTNPSDQFRFGTGNASAFSELFRISASGQLGINLGTAPWSALDIKGNLSFTNLFLPPPAAHNMTNIAGGIFMNSDVNQTPAAFMGVMTTYNSVSGVTLKGVGIGSLQPQPNMLFAVQINHGGLILDKREGVTGEVMRSGGSAGPAYWSSSPDIALYDNTGTVCDNLMYELSEASPTLTLQRLGYQPTLDRFTKVLFQTNIKVFAAGCALCGSTIFDLRILQNGVVVRNYRYTVANGTARILNTATLFDLLPGTPAITVQLARVSGPALSVSSDYNCRTVKFIPEM